MVFMQVRISDVLHVKKCPNRCVMGNMVPDFVITVEPVRISIRVRADIVRAPGAGAIWAGTLDGAPELDFCPTAAVVVMRRDYVSQALLKKI